MKEKVVVTSNPKTGLVVTRSDENPQWGYCRVEQERMVVDESTGILRLKKLSALVPGTIIDLERLGWKDGQELPGHVIFREQMLPFNKKNPDQNLKIAGETGVVCKVKGEPIYRNTFWNPREDAKDTPIPHDNIEEIRLAQLELAKEAAESKPDDLDL
jgi:hypothetical protein